MLKPHDLEPSRTKMAKQLTDASNIISAAVNAAQMLVTVVISGWK